METNQNNLNQKVEFEELSEADRYGNLAWFCNRDCKRAIGWSIFLAIVGLLLVVGFVVVNLPLINGEPIYAIDGLPGLILLLSGAVMNLIAVIVAAKGKKLHNDAYTYLLKRENALPKGGVTPLIVKMI